MKVANCFNHLDFEWESPIWRHWVTDLAGATVLCATTAEVTVFLSGKSKTSPSTLGFTIWKPWWTPSVCRKFALLGHSQGGPIAIAYAVRRPERASHLVLCGAYSRGVRHREHPDAV